MSRVQRLLAVGQDDQRTGRRDPTRYQPQHVERGLVSPVNVLYHEHGRRVRAQVLDQRLGDLVRDRAVPKTLCKPRPDVVEFVDRA